MTEKEIRGIIKQVFARIDRNARKVVLPTMLGAGLALSGGCSDRATTQEDGSVQTDGTQQKLDGVIGYPDAAYMGPDLTPNPDAVRLDLGPYPDVAYMGPDASLPDGGPIPPYMAPDAGPVPPYMAPDGGPQPDYMAPDDDGGLPPPQPLYAAPP